MNTVIRFVWESDELCNIWQNNKHIYAANHDDHGWDGMVGIIEAFKVLAMLNNWEVDIVGQEGV